MGKRKRKKISGTLTWKTLRGFFRLLFQGIFKASPLLLFGLAGFAVYWGIRANLYADPGFLVQEVRVTPEGVLAPVRLQELDRLCLGKNLFRVSLREISKGLEQDPGIQEARVIRDFPRTLKVEVTPRRAFAQVQLNSHGPYHTAGEDGVILDSGFKRDDRLLLIEAYEPRGARAEMGRKFNLAGLDAALELARAFWGHPLGKSETIQSLRLDHLGNVALQLKKGPELRFGRSPLKKMSMLEAARPLLTGADRDRITYIELQYQDLVVRRK